jgi:hypothetical protein
MPEQLRRTNRRTFLKSASATAAMLSSAHASAAAVDQRPIELSQEHRRAVDRRRRIVVQYDAHNALGRDFEAWIQYRFAYADEPGSQIDALWWDIDTLGPGAYPAVPGNPQLEPWRKRGIDWVGRLVEETRKRGLEVFWSHRVSEVDINPSGQGAAWKSLSHPFKREHPDWLLKTWWPHGLWDYSVAEVRRFKVGLLRQLVERYDLDGIQLDFARHVPCLPPPRQWELRHHVTEFVRVVRTMLLEVAQERGHPILLAARVPRNLEGCRVDGFDVEAWACQNLVDILTLGTRSVDVDVAGYLRATAEGHVKLQPCLDDHHATDGYRYPPIEFFRGVFANWWQQGADAVVTFNWSNAPPELCEKMEAKPGPASQRQAYHEAGSLETLSRKDKTFVVERRGGYPWAEGFFNRNDTAPLPVTLAEDGKPTQLAVRASDDLSAPSDRLEHVTLRAILFGASEGQELEVRLGGAALRPTARDPGWKDPQIFSPRPQPASGGSGNYKVNPRQKLLRLDFAVDPRHCRVGENPVELRLIEAAKRAGNVVLEKLELHVEYT